MPKFFVGILQCLRKIGVSKNSLHDRGYHNFPSKIFCLTEPNYFTGEHCGVSGKLFYRRFPCIGGGHHDSADFFLSHRIETTIFVKETFCFPKNFWYRKKLWMRGGISQFSVEIFISQSSERFRKGILLFLVKFFGSNFFMDENGGITFFRLKFLVSQCRKFSWASLQCFRKFGVSKNSLLEKGYHNFPSKFFCLTVPKFFIGEHFGVSEKFFFEIFHANEVWGITILSIFFVPQYQNENFCKGTLLFSRKFWYRKKFMAKRGHITIFSRNLYVSQCLKIS